MAKDSFVLYKSFFKPISKLSDKQLGRLFRAIYTYQIDGEATVEEDIEMAFEFFKNQFEIDESYVHHPPSGEEHWNWKGGITDENHRQRESSEYKQWRKSVFERDSFTCQICGQTGGILNAHHIKPFSIYHELRFVVDNGITLCKKCHVELHKRDREWVQ